jgi:competence protein ComFC
VSVPPRMCRWQDRRMSLPDEFGRALHDSLGLRYQCDALISAVDHIEVKRIAFEHRRKAVTGTFAVTTSKLAGKTVLLVDDITTTGATLAECAQQLRNAGASVVFAYTLGRTADFARDVSRWPV